MVQDATRPTCGSVINYSVAFEKWTRHLSKWSRSRRLWGILPRGKAFATIGIRTWLTKCSESKPRCEVIRSTFWKPSTL
jgi:hypothetical protein